MLHDLFETVRDCPFPEVIVHPVRFGAKTIASNRKRITRQTMRATFVTFLLAQATGPATPLAPEWPAHFCGSWTL
jgi:hypothetical protein